MSNEGNGLLLDARIGPQARDAHEIAVDHHPLVLRDFRCFFERRRVEGDDR
jgi:hypothetical protein